MKSFSEVCALLRRRNARQYALLAGCCFFSVLLITAYVGIMRSPTVLSVLPEGGDSRKQVMMIFVLAVIGCAVFTTYAAGLFLRQRSRELGVFLALGASRAQVSGVICRELAGVSIVSCLLGAALGMPLAWGLWSLLRTFLVDTQEMALRFDYRVYSLSALFSLFVIVMTLALGVRSVRRTNILDIVHEQHRSEPVREVPRRWGVIGIVLVAVGVFLGYMSSSFFILVLHWYPPEGLTAVFYAPALVGLYMLLLHTVVNGWGGRKRKYRDLISTSMMKFQGRQTVRNMLVITVLVAGAYFGSFYTPMLGTGAMIRYDAREYDCLYFHRADQNIPGEDEVRALAGEYGVEITDFAGADAALLAVDGTRSVEVDGPMGTTWYPEYLEVYVTQRFLSESDFNALTGRTLDVPAGQAAAVLDAEGSPGYGFDPEISIVTNYLTGERLEVTPYQGEAIKHQSLTQRYVLDDGDYERITRGLTGEWYERTAVFNVENEERSYDFAKALFNEIVDCSGPEVEVYDSWDPVIRDRYLAEEGEYFLDSEALAEAGEAPIDYSQRDSSNFRLSWKYMPQFRVLDKADFVKTVAVYLMLFVFVAIVCFSAVMVIAYTRCMTIALTNRQVYEDLRRLGAPGKYLYRSVRGQVKRVFFTPIFTGTLIIYVFYVMIMYFNGSPAGITADELAGLLASLGVIAGVSALLYGVYRLTLRKVCASLSVKRRT